MFITSCSDKKEENKNEIVTEPKTENKEEISKDENRDSLILLQNFYDSIRLVDFRKNAFRLANEPITKRIKTEIYEDGKVVVFQNVEKFLYIKFDVASWKQKTEFYNVRDSIPNLVWEETWEGSNFLGDTIIDINGDNQLDILTNFYPSSGCCRRNSFWIRLFDTQNRKFAEKIRMINPTFYPEEKIVRGINYGHPGEVPIYKMKWRGIRLDTVEYIHPFPKEKGKFLITKKYEIYPQRQLPPKGKIIYSLPKEYEDIESIEWFLDY